MAMIEDTLTQIPLGLGINASEIVYIDLLYQDLY